MSEILRVGISPYNQMNPRCLALYAQGIRDCDPGMELELLNVIAAMINVTLELRSLAANDYGCGLRLANGTWTGLLGMLQRDEIDVTGNLCSIETDRIEVPDFEPSQPVLQHRQGFLIRKPIVEYKFDIAGPFQTHVWMAAACLLVAILLLNRVSSWILSYDLDRDGSRVIVEGREKGSRASSSDSVADPSVTRMCSKDLGQDSRASSRSRSRPSRTSSRDPGVWDESDIQSYPTLVITWTAFLAFTTGIYGAYITGVFLEPVQKERPFNDHVQLADSLSNGEYLLLDYHQTGSHLPLCYSNSTCEKFRLAFDRRKYVEGSESLLAHLVAPQSPNLVVVNSVYWLQIYADYFDSRRSDLWLIEDELSGEEWFSFFRRRNNTSVARRFDHALIQLDSFKYYVPDLYIGLGRNIYQERYFRGPLLETYRMDLRLFRGAAKLYAIGIAIAILAFASERGWRSMEDHIDQCGQRLVLSIGK